jgi:hypothetical protein
MTVDVATTPAQTPTRPSEKERPPLKVLVLSPTLVPGSRTPAPVEFANALEVEGVSVMFAAAIGPLRTGLSRTIGYFMIDDADHAPIKTAHELTKILRHHPPDIVHAHGARSALVAALAIKASHVHCARVMSHLARLRRFPRLIKAPVITHCADRYFAAADALRSELEALGVPSERILSEPSDPGNAALESITVYRSLVAPPRGEA